MSALLFLFMMQISIPIAANVASVASPPTSPAPVVITIGHEHK